MKNMFFWAFLPKIIKNEKTRAQIEEVIEKEKELMKKYQDLAKDSDYVDLGKDSDDVDDVDDVDDEKDSYDGIKDTSPDDHAGEHFDDEYEENQDFSISRYLGTPTPTDFEETNEYFYYGWEGKTDIANVLPVTIRRRERNTGHLQQGYTHTKTYLEAWASKESLIYSNL